MRPVLAGRTAALIGLLVLAPSAAGLAEPEPIRAFVDRASCDVGMSVLMTPCPHWSWERETPGSIQALAESADENVYAVGADGPRFSIESLDLEGETRWRSTLTEGRFDAVSASEGAVVAAGVSPSGFLVASFHPVNGALQWMWSGKLGSVHHVSGTALDSAGGRFYLVGYSLSSGGWVPWVIALALANGAEVWRVPVPHFASATATGAALSPDGGHLYIVTLEDRFPHATTIVHSLDLDDRAFDICVSHRSKPGIRPLISMGQADLVFLTYVVQLDGTDELRVEAFTGSSGGDGCGGGTFLEGTFWYQAPAIVTRDMITSQAGDVAYVAAMVYHGDWDVLVLGYRNFLGSYWYRPAMPGWVDARALALLPFEDRLILVGSARGTEPTESNQVAVAAFEARTGVVHGQYLYGRERDDRSTAVLATSNQGDVMVAADAMDPSDGATRAYRLDGLRAGAVQELISPKDLGWTTTASGGLIHA